VELRTLDQVLDRTKGQDVIKCQPRVLAHT
jgi:hypothetical protein